MSSWIPSFFNPNPDPDPDPSSDEDDPLPITSSSPKTHSSGVKEDLSAVFRGVAAFLAPPPTTSFSGSSSPSSSDAIAGIRNDLAEIQGSFKSGLSLISSKLTSNLLQFQNQINDDDDDGEEEEEDEDTVGITEEVVGFVRKLSMRPELWTDFPLSLADDFNLSDYQREHAENIDHFVPELATLRQKICSQMSEEKFWIIYFILLFPRLNEEDLKLLSTPQVVELRETLLNKLQNKSDSIEEKSKSPMTSDINTDSGKLSITDGDEPQSVHKNVEIFNATKQMDDTIKTTEENDSDSQKKFKNEEDISFSDLEDDDQNELSEKLSVNEVSKSDREKESEGEDSSGWLAVDDKDFDNLEAI